MALVHRGFVRSAGEDFSMQCAVCSQPTCRFSCAACGIVYCSKAHQRKDLPYHSSKCGQRDVLGVAAAKQVAPLEFASQYGCETIVLQQNIPINSDFFELSVAFLAPVPTLLRLRRVCTTVRKVADASPSWEFLVLNPGDSAATNAEVDAIIRKHGLSVQAGSKLRALRSTRISHGESSLHIRHLHECSLRFIALRMRAARLRRSTRAGVSRQGGPDCVVLNGALPGLVGLRLTLNAVPIMCTHGQKLETRVLSSLCWSDPSIPLDAFRPPAYCVGLATSCASKELYKLLDAQPDLARQKRVLELGGGTGLLGLSCLLRGCIAVVCTEIDERLLRILRANAALAEVDVSDLAAGDSRSQLSARSASLPLRFGKEHLPGFRRACEVALPDVFGDAPRPCVEGAAMTLGVTSAMPTSTEGDAVARTKQSDLLFDTVLAADVLYGLVAEQTARDLIQSVEGLLRPTGVFLLALTERGSNCKSVVMSAAASAGLAGEFLLESRHEHGVSLLKFQRMMH